MPCTHQNRVLWTCHFAPVLVSSTSRTPGTLILRIVNFSFRSNIMSGPLVISLKDKLEFIESLLIPAFDPDNELDSSKKRKEWLAIRAEQKKWDAKVAAELIERYGTVASLEEAKLVKVKATEEAKMVMAEENERKQGTLKRSRQDAILIMEGIYPAPSMSEDTKLFEFSTEYNLMLERDPTALALRIFMREENMTIARRLDEFVASNDLLFYLQGPPGVGKTKESLIWILQSVVKDSKTWAWIPLIKSGGTGVAQMVYLLDRSDTVSKSVRYRVFHTSDLATDLYDWGVKVVVFDNGNQVNRGPIDACVSMNLKTITVSSLQMKFDNSFSRQQAYTVNGWKEAEYLEACQDNDFYNSIKVALQTGDFTEEELGDPAVRGEVVAAKYHLAGGSARWMFQFSAEQLLSPAGNIQSIDNHLGRVSCNQIIAGFFGDRGTTEVNHLLSRINGRAVIVSQYVANQLVIRHGEALLRQAQLLLGNCNPAMDGVLMKMDFITRLGRSTPEKNMSIDLVMESGANPVPVLQSGGQKIKFRLSTFATAEFIFDDEDWFIPDVFNNGGFDCVQYRTGKLIYVQVTRSAADCFNLKWYQKFRSAFVEKYPELAIATCEVWFVVQEGLLDTFAPATSSGELTGCVKGAYKVAGMRRIRA